MTLLLNPTMCSFDELITVAAAAARAAGRSGGWKPKYAPVVGAYLLLFYQVESPTSYYLIGDAGDKTPLFPTTWLAARLQQLRPTALRTCYEFWKWGIGRAEESRYPRLVRCTAAEFLRDPSYEGGCAVKDASYALRVGLGATVPPFRQVHFSADGAMIATKREYPGWIVDSLAH